MGLLRASLLAPLVVVFGCGDDAVPQMVDAAQGCPVPAGRAYAVQMTVAGPGVGFDLDRDGTVDNGFGELPSALLRQINNDLEFNFAMSSTFFVFNIDGWTDPPSANDPALVMGAMLAIDADTDPQNNFTGTSRLLADPSSYDLNCELTIRFDQASIENDVLTASASSLLVPFLGWQTLTFREMQLQATFDTEYTTFPFTIGGTLPICSLSQSGAAGTTAGTMLDVLVNNQEQTNVRPDIDLDGDGLETMIGDGATIAECIDGDGVTHIPGPTCACDPRIKDGYSIAVTGTGTLVHIVGSR